jgi:hypothetical protein
LLRPLTKWWSQGTGTHRVRVVEGAQYRYDRVPAAWSRWILPDGCPIVVQAECTELVVTIQLGSQVFIAKEKSTEARSAANSPRS